MIQKVSHNLYVGDIEACKLKGNYAKIHAAKHPCYTNLFGNKVDKTSPHYLYFETEKDLYLNIVDSDEPLFYKETFDSALRFIEKNIQDNKVLIHCNEGKSRSVAIAMVYLFRELSYVEAKRRFLDIYDYELGFGIDTFLLINWDRFSKFGYEKD